MKNGMKKLVQLSIMATVLSVVMASGTVFAGGPNNTMFTGKDLEYIREMNSGKVYAAEPEKTATATKKIPNTMLTDQDQEVMQAGKIDIPVKPVENKPVVKKRTIPNTMFTDADQEYLNGSQDSLNLEALSDSAPTAMGE